MHSKPPDLLLSYDDTLPEVSIQPFIDAVKAPGLSVAIEPRPASGPLAGLQWLLPTAVIVYIGKSYFDGFLKEAGKDHYNALQRGLSTLWPLFFGDKRGFRITVRATPGKTRPDDAKYSLGVSILAEAASGLHFKLLFPDEISAEELNGATANFLDFLKKYYAGELDRATELRLGGTKAAGRTILLTYDSEKGFFRFLDPFSKEAATGSE